MPSHCSYKWLDTSNRIISCKEKNKIMRENMVEFQQNSQDILEDAVLMGCQAQQVKHCMLTIIESLLIPYE